MLRNAAPLEVVVLGGGPIGMRAAVEMALLGHKVYLLWLYSLWRCSGTRYTYYGILAMALLGHKVYLLWYTYYGAAGARGILTMAILTMALLGHKVYLLWLYLLWRCWGTRYTCYLFESRYLQLTLTSYYFLLTAYYSLPTR